MGSVAHEYDQNCTANKQTRTAYSSHVPTDSQDMGKKSRRCTRATSATPEAGNDSKPVPRQRILFPKHWDANLAAILPFARLEYQYVCIDAEKYIDKGDGTSEVNHKNKAKQIEHYSDCPMCFKIATLQCAVCKTVSYCGKDCQRAHWKLSHKKACHKNPNPYKFHLNLKSFEGLTAECFQGHEFLVVKPTEQVGSSSYSSTLQEICDQVIEPADDLLDIPGFGQNQLDAMWLIDNKGHPVYQTMVERFGWTSGVIAHELVSGYRVAEARIMYFMWCDDSFQEELSLAPSYYGQALFPPLPPGKNVRGNLVVYKVLLRNKQRRPKLNQDFLSLMLQVTDDSDIQFEYTLMPMNKAELALMLSERRKAVEKGAYSTRMWRHQIRVREIQQERGSAQSLSF